MKVMYLKADSDELEVKDVNIEVTEQSSYELIKEGVGGWIESLQLGFAEEGRMVTVWLNEEGKLIGLPPNFGLVFNGEIQDIVMGNIIITSTDHEGETVGLTDKEVEFVKSRFTLDGIGITPYGLLTKFLTLD